MVKIGDTLTFVPTAYNAGNGTETSREWLKQAKVTGTVVQIHEAHRWYRVRYKPKFDREQHECFKF